MATSGYEYSLAKNMATANVLAILLAVVRCLHLSDGSSHWVVTENGRIQAQVASKTRDRGSLRAKKYSAISLTFHRTLAC